MFDKKNLKPGYLVRCTALKDQENLVKGEQFNALVTRARSMYGLFFKVTGDEFLGVCNPTKWWAPISGLDPDTLTWAESVRIDEVWGPAYLGYSMSYDTTTRARLWIRNETRRMTLAEVEKALGYTVKIVDGTTDRTKDGKRPFGKSQLQPGMVVERRDGTKWVVAPSKEGLFLAGAPVKSPVSPSVQFTPSIRLDRYTDNLIWVDTSAPNAKRSDIMKVWNVVTTTNYAEHAFTTDTEARQLVWVRDERKPMTVEEIEKALGYPVLIVADTVDVKYPPKPVKM